VASFDYYRRCSTTVISLGVIHDLMQACAKKAGNINASEDLSLVRVWLKDELFQSGRPMLTEIDADSTYCYFLTEVGHRDETT
jgi:hypothetical protein